MPSLRGQHNARRRRGWVPLSLRHSAVLQHSASKAFSCECAASELVSSVVLLDYLGRGSVNRHVFDLDGVCHVGEMISAPADVLKGAAGKVNHGAKAKSRPEIHTSAHEYILCKHHAGNACLFSVFT